MATFKACVQKKRNDGMYIVYIRLTQLRKIAYIKTSWMVSEKGISKKSKEITDAYVLEQSSKLIKSYYNILNDNDVTSWTVKEVADLF